MEDVTYIFVAIGLAVNAILFVGFLISIRRRRQWEEAVAKRNRQQAYEQELLLTGVQSSELPESVLVMAKVFFEHVALLRTSAETIAVRASSLTNLSASTRVTTIVLGAIIATSGTATQIWGDGNAIILVVYTVLGVIIAAVGGIEAAFKLQSNANARRLLSSEIEGRTAALRAAWVGDVMFKESVDGDDSEVSEQRSGRARRRLDEIVEYYGAVQKRAAELGVNLPRERLIIELRADQDDPGRRPRLKDEDLSEEGSS